MLFSYLFQNRFDSLERQIKAPIGQIISQLPAMAKAGLESGRRNTTQVSHTGDRNPIIRWALLLPLQDFTSKKQESGTTSGSELSSPPMWEVAIWTARLTTCSPWPSINYENTYGITNSSLVGNRSWSPACHVVGMAHCLPAHDLSTASSPADLCHD